MVALFTELPGADVHVRAYDYLRLEGLLDLFSEAEQTLFAGGRSQCPGGSRPPRGAFFRRFSPSPSPATFSRRTEETSMVAGASVPGAGLLATLVESASGAGYLQECAALLKLVAENEADPLQLQGIQEARARALRLQRRHREARELYRELARLNEAAGAEEKAERFRWYGFSSLVKSNPKEAVTELPRLILGMRDPGYYTDVLTELADRLCVEHLWPEILAAYRVLDGTVAADVLSRYAYLSARLIEEGLVAGIVDLTSGEILRRLAAGEYPGAAVAPGAAGAVDPYYRLLALVRTGQPAGELLPETPAGGEATEEDLLTAGFVRYGLPAQAVRLAYSKAVSPAAAVAAATVALEEGLAEEGVRLLLRRDLPAPATLYYPRPFLNMVEEAATREDLAPWLLFALIRQESLFNPRAISYVGAQGLTQLMPATAAEVAGRLRIDKADPFDPEVNLRLGAWYLKHLIERTESYSDAVAAYNAGINRVRRWRRSFGGLPDDLFFEALPYEETRNYTKRLLVSSHYYGYLYYRDGGAATVRAFFPAF